MESMFYVTGFGSLSSHIASDQDQTASVYKRFDKLAARDLLYFQSELQDLQARQDRFDREDAADVTNSSPEEWSIRENAQNWSSWKASARKEKRKDARWRARMELAMRIRKTLKEYREALVLHASVHALPSPSTQSRAAISQMFHPTSNIDETILTGSSSSLYPSPFQRWHPVDQDYVSLTRPPDSNLLSYLLKEYCSKLFPLYKSKDLFNQPKDTLTHAVSWNIRYYSLEAINFTVDFISTILAAALLFIPIYSLYHVSKDRPNITMGLIAMFTLLFAATIALVTSAKRGEIFGATAAYAAVLVVFVSGDFAAGRGDGA